MRGDPDDKPFEQRVTNPGFEDRFTCPGCYHDHRGAPSAVTKCERCKRPLRCSIERQPVAVCELAGNDEQDEAA